MRCRPINDANFNSVIVSEPAFLTASITANEPTVEIAWLKGLTIFVSSRPNWNCAGKHCLDIAWYQRKLHRSDENMEQDLNICPSDEDIIRTSQFIFAVSTIEDQVIHSIREHPGPLIGENRETSELDLLVCVMLSLSRINSNGLENCKDMPLTMDQDVLNNLDGFPPTKLTDCFETTCCLLLGHRYPLDYVRTAVLVSAWGWSVIHGCLSRRGLRRPRIIDGPTSSPKVGSMRLAVTDINVRKHDICNARMRLPMVGFHSDAFQAVSVFDWSDEQGHWYQGRIGF